MSRLWPIVVPPKEKPGDQAPEISDTTKDNTKRAESVLITEYEYSYSSDKKGGRFDMLLVRSGLVRTSWIYS
jgi:hypothetical protein